MQFSPVAQHKRADPEVLVLLSGGVDSAACLRFYLDVGRRPCGLFIDYRQTAAEQEARAAQRIARYFDVKLYEARWHGRDVKELGAIAGRNAFFLAAALMERPLSTSVVATGIHAGTDYADCSKTFIGLMKELFHLYSAGKVQVASPFLDWSKADIWSYASDHNVPIDLTYSCEAGHIDPCGKCLSCIDREAMTVNA